MREELERENIYEDYEEIYTDFVPHAEKLLQEKCEDEYKKVAKKLHKWVKVARRDLIKWQSKAR